LFVVVRGLGSEGKKGRKEGKKTKKEIASQYWRSPESRQYILHTHLLRVKGKRNVEERKGRAAGMGSSTDESSQNQHHELLDLLD